jgi:intergrase/recombinase
MAGPLGFEPKTSNSADVVCAPNVEIGLIWADLRWGFRQYLDSQNYCRSYVTDILRYLDRHFKVINYPQDIIGIFSQVKKGRRSLWLSFRVLFNYLVALGYDEGIINVLRKSLPNANCSGVDLKVPEEQEIIRSLNAIKNATSKYLALYNLLIDSGLRLVEAMKVITEFNPDKAEQVNGFYRVEIGAFRGNKQAFYGYFTEYTFKLLCQVSDKSLRAATAAHRCRKHKAIAPKYLRKFAFDKMVELEIPESVADFIEGRVPKRIGAKHYMVLRRQADKFYGKYDEYLKTLRSKVPCA